jgi:hypothetical protein
VGRDASQSVRSVRLYAHLDKRSTGGLLFAGLGFSLAYFLDAAQGPARRKHVADVFHRVRSERAADAAKDDRAAADLPRIGWADSGPRATFQRAADGIRVSGRV